MTITGPGTTIIVGANQVITRSVSTGNESTTIRTSTMIPGQVIVTKIPVKPLHRPRRTNEHR